MAILRRERVGVVAKFMQRLHGLNDDRRKEGRAAAKQYMAGNERPLIDFIKALVSDPENLKALLKILVLLAPLIALL